MNVRNILAATALVALTFAPAIASAQPRSDEERAVLAAVERMFDGMRMADSAMTRSVFAPGARFAMLDTRSGAAVVRYDTVGGWIAAIASSNKRWDEQIYDVQVKVDGTIAHVWAPYTFYLDKQVRHCGVNTIDLLKDAQGWKVTQIADTRRRENCPDPLKR